MQYDLELVFVKNSHEFVHEYLKKPEFVDLMRRLGALGDGNQDQSKSLLQLISSRGAFRCVEMFILTLTNAGTLSPDEWEVAYLYLSFVLKKVSLKHPLYGLPVDVVGFP